MVLTYDNIGGIRKIIADWTSDDTTGAVAGTTVKIIGELIKGTTDPGATAPTTLYDIVLTDAEGVNLLGLSADDLLNRSATVTEEVYFGLTTQASAFPVVADLVTISVSNAGNSKLGQLIIYYRHAP